MEIQTHHPGWGFADKLRVGGIFQGEHTDEAPGGLRLNIVYREIISLINQLILSSSHEP